MTDIARHPADRPVPSKSDQAQAPAGAGFLLPEVTALLATAAREINAHVNINGLCSDCGSAFPCPRAQLAEFTLGPLAHAGCPCAPAPVRKHGRVFPATPRHVREARAFLAAALYDCPIADDAVLCLSELASNAVLHSDSRKPGGTFAVRVEVHDSDYVWIEVEDNGGRWQERTPRDGRPHGLEIIRQLTVDSGKDGDCLTGWVMWAQLDWAVPAPRRPIPPSPQR